MNWVMARTTTGAGMLQGAVALLLSRRWMPAVAESVNRIMIQGLTLTAMWAALTALNRVRLLISNN